MYSFVAFSQVPFPCEGQFFITHSESSNSPTTLSNLTIDPITQNVSFDPIKTLDFNFNAIGLRSSDLLIYGINPSTWEFYQVDANGDSQLLDTIDHPEGSFSVAGAITPDGQYLVLYALENFQSASDKLILIDLTDPDYNELIRPVLGSSHRIFDIAFDPLNGDLYGFDSEAEKLVRINVDNGAVAQVFPASSLVSSVGGLFFDSFGNLFAYGAPTGSQAQSIIFAVDKTTGQFNILGNGPIARGNDACSCPYTIQMQKRVTPTQGFPCSTITYEFIIANQSGTTQPGVRFQDVLPSGMTFIDVVRNPFQGEVTGIGTESVSFENMTIPTGADTLVITVEVGELPPGSYKNQALLFDLPARLGLTAISDDPTTFALEDSTTFEVLEINQIPNHDTLTFCAGLETSASIMETGVSINWSIGSTGNNLSISEPGQYLAEVDFGCIQRVDTFTIIEHEISVAFDVQRIEVLLGDQVSLMPQIQNTGLDVHYTWKTEPSLIIGCTDCSTLDLLANEFNPVELCVMNEFGCLDSTFIKFKTRRSFYIPNVFSPNNDGANDVFKPEGSGFKSVELSIFDRWGALVHRYIGPFNSSLVGWNGTTKSTPNPSGVYTWTIRLEFIDTFVHQEIGTVTLLR